MTGHDIFNPTSLHTRDYKLTTWGCEMDTLAPASMFGDVQSILNTDAMKLLAFPMQGTPCHCYPTKQAGKKPALQANLEP